MTTTAIPFPAPSNAGQYAEDLDAYLGAPLTPAGEAVTSAWVQSESATFPGFNGLGTTLELPGSTPVPGNSANVQEYPTLAEGLQAARDMMLGEGPQTTPLAPAFVADLRSGTASEQALTNDVAASLWDGTAPDSYDAGAIAAKLGESGFSVAGPSSSTSATLASGYGLNPIKDLQTLAGNTSKSLLGSIGIYVLKAIVSLTGAAIFVYGAKLTTEHGPAKQSSSSGPGVLPGDAGGAPSGPAEAVPKALEAFPEAAAL